MIQLCQKVHADFLTMHHVYLCKTIQEDPTTAASTHNYLVTPNNIVLRVVPISTPVTENASDTAENAGTRIVSTPVCAPIR